MYATLRKPLGEENTSKNGYVTTGIGTGKKNTTRATVSFTNTLFPSPMAIEALRRRKEM